MFHPTEQTGNLHWTARTEKAGKANVPASTAWFEFNAANDVLNHFDPDLKFSLYRKLRDSEMDIADGADERMSDPNYLPKLRHPDISNEFLTMKGSIVGATLVIHGRTDAEYPDCVVDSYQIGPREGGTVRVKMRVNFKPQNVQWFYDNNGQEVIFSIEPPTEAQGSLIDGSADGGAPPADDLTGAVLRMVE